MLIFHDVAAANDPLTLEEATQHHLAPSIYQGQMMWFSFSCVLDLSPC